jgi:hypothetical protein
VHLVAGRISGTERTVALQGRWPRRAALAPKWEADDLRSCCDLGPCRVARRRRRMHRPLLARGGRCL